MDPAHASWQSSSDWEDESEPAASGSNLGGTNTPGRTNTPGGNSATESVAESDSSSELLSGTAAKLEMDDDTGEGDDKVSELQKYADGFSNTLNSKREHPRLVPRYTPTPPPPYKTGPSAGPSLGPVVSPSRQSSRSTSRVRKIYEGTRGSTGFTRPNIVGEVQAPVLVPSGSQTNGQLTQQDSVIEAMHEAMTNDQAMTTCSEPCLNDGVDETVREATSDGQIMTTCGPAVQTDQGQLGEVQTIPVEANPVQAEPVQQNSAEINPNEADLEAGQATTTKDTNDPTETTPLTNTLGNPAIATTVIQRVNDWISPRARVIGRYLIWGFLMAPWVASPFLLYRLRSGSIDANGIDTRDVQGDVRGELVHMPDIVPGTAVQESVMPEDVESEFLVGSGRRWTCNEWDCLEGDCKECEVRRMAELD